ncbi:MFS transporter [Marinomonas sp. SBI22]|nr:MFS transporter [Marinomonas sp. SBI8L]KZM43525.1 MFS transporter [Marinomonas sp. SBI22]
MKRIYYFLSGEAGNYYIINGLTALSYALVIPILSIFLIDGLGFEPIYIGIYTVAYTVSGIYITQKFGALADKGVDHKVLFIIALMGIVCAAMSYAFLNAFWQIMIAGTLFMGVARASIPMILIMVRHFAESSATDPTQLNAQIRSSVSFIWILGPPLAFLLVDKIGFQFTFLMAACAGVFVAFYAWGKLPQQEKASAAKGKSQALQNQAIPRVVYYLGAVLFLGNVANSNYITAMPLYLTNDLNLPVSFPGLLLGLTAACEIPIMLMSAKWAKAIGTTKVLLLSFIAAMVFYILSTLIESMLSFILIQIINGVFYGIFVGVGISLLQDKAPNCIGKATAYYSNMMALGSMAGASLMGIVAQYFGYKEALFISFGAILIAFIMLFFYELLMRKNQALQEA